MLLETNYTIVGNEAEERDYVNNFHWNDSILLNRFGRKRNMFRRPIIPIGVVFSYSF